MARHDNRSSRREGNRRARRRVLVYCGGKRTEPEYFNGLRRSAIVGHVVVEVRQRGVAPEQLVRSAVAFVRRSPQDYDEVWCVFDVDEFDIREAVREAREQGVNLAVSNPCFELWLLLHFERCRSHLRDYEAVVVKLKKHVPDYDKSVSFRHFEGRVATAIENAKSLDSSGAEHSKNPSTSVWRLVETIVGQNE